jgi:pimeloyl-ACP methyl ester carboxylesterase
MFRNTEAQLGTVRVPVRHSVPDGPALELRFVRLATRASKPQPPVVYLTGGPGLSGIRAGEGRLYPMFDALRDRSDVVLLDQRACVAPAPEVPRKRLFDDRGVVTRDEYLRVIDQSIREEAERFDIAGIPVDALNTNESADDIALLTRALYGEHARVSLLGWSYGSHLAMAIIKRHEAMVANAVLAAPEGPNHTYKRPVRIQEHIQRLARRIDPPFDLMGSLSRVLEKPPGQEIGRFELEWIISDRLADPRAIRLLPAWLSQMERGINVITGEQLLRGAWETLRTELPHAVVRYAMDCASGATAERRAQIEREARETLLGNTIDFPLPEICEAVGCPDLGDEFRAAPRSDVPVLFVTGSLDCRTPVENVRELAPGFSRYQHIEVEDAGHGDLLLPTRVQGAIVEFLKTGTVASTKLRADEPLRFDPVP